MTDTTRERLELHRVLAQQLGDEPAGTLMAHLNDHPSASYATSDSVLAIAATLRGEMAELRGEMAELRADLRNELADMKRWTVSVILAGNTALVAAVVGVMSAMS